MSYGYQGVGARSTDNIPLGDKPGPYGYGFSNDITNPPRSGHRKWAIIGGVLGLLLLIGIGVGVGVGVSQANKNKGGSSSGSSKPGQAAGSEANFAKDANLKKSFRGLAYTPEGSLMPNCGNSQEAVIHDIQLISQLTNKIRLYGADCNQTALVLEAIQRTNTDVQVYLGNYITPDDDVAYQRQKAALKSALETYGTDHVAGITVGNEFMLNYLTAHQATDPDSAVGQQGAQILLNYIQDTRTMLTELNLPKTIQVGNSDAGSFFSKAVLSAVDYGLSNVHPWFANTTIEAAAGWTWDFFQNNNVALAASLPNNPHMAIAEVGWPSKSSDAGNANNGFAEASEVNLQKFMDNFVCQSNVNNIDYFYFEFSDEPWKDAQFGGVEGWWGLFNTDRTLKSITIPDCLIS